jgi:hypothetical protein
MHKKKIRNVLDMKKIRNVLNIRAFSFSPSL